MQFALGIAQKLLGLRAMSCHVVVVRRAGMIHFLHSFLNMVMGTLQIGNITYLLSQHDTSRERQTH